MESKTINEYLKYKFSEEEKREIASGMAAHITAKEESEEEKKVVMGQFKNRIDGFEAHISAAAAKINSGYEMRQIECEMIPNISAKQWEITRKDTGVVIRTQKMTDDERQMKIDE